MVDNIIAEGGDEPKVVPRTTPRAEEFQALWKSPINGHVPKPVARPEEVEQEQLATTVEPIEDVLEVRNIIFDSTGGRSFAYVSYKDDSPEVSIAEKVLAAREGQGVIWVVNRVTMASKFARVAVLSDGQLVEQGTYDELNKEGTALHELLQSS